MKNFSSSKKTLVFLIALMSSLHSVNGQSDKVIHFGAHFNPKYSMPIVSDKDLLIAENTTNFSFGADVYYDISSSIQFFSGLIYTQLSGKQIDYLPFFGCDFYATDFARNSWFADEFTLRYLGIPLGANFKLLGDKNHLFAKVGLDFLVNIAAQSETLVHECGTPARFIIENPFIEAEDFLLNGKLGLGVELGIGKEMKLIIEPQIEYTANSIFKNPSSFSENQNQKLLSLGFLVGVRF